jgi:hypothetical protein
MFKPHERYTAVFPVLEASNLPDAGTIVELTFKGWYDNRLLFVVWPAGKPIPKEFEGRQFLYVNQEAGTGVLTLRTAINGTGEPPFQSYGVLSIAGTSEELGTLLIEFHKV